MGDMRFLTDAALTFTNCELADGIACQIGLGLGKLKDFGNLQSVKLKFFRCTALSDEGCIQMVKELPGHLEKLTLDFSRCEKIGTRTLRCVARYLRLGLRELCLGFNFCALTDVGLVDLCHKLPSSLLLLDLGLASCTQVTGASLVKVAQHLPEGLLDARLDFRRCCSRLNETVERTAFRLPRTLRSLEVSLWSCRGVQEWGLLDWVVTAQSQVSQFRLDVKRVGGISNKWMEGLTSGLAGMGGLALLQLHLTECPEITGIGVVALAKSLDGMVGLRDLELCIPPCGTSAAPMNNLLRVLPTKLLRLHLNFHGCVISKSGLQELADRISMMESLWFCKLILDKVVTVVDERIKALCAAWADAPVQVLHLSVRHTKIASGGVAALAANLPTTVVDLHLDFEGCSSVQDPGVQALARRLPTALRRLMANFTSCAVSQRWRQQFDSLAEFHDKVSCMVARGKPAPKRVTKWWG